MVIRGQGPVLRLVATWNFEKRMRLLYQKNSIIFLSACQLLLVLIIGFGGLLSDSVAAAPRVDRVAVIFQEKLSQHQQVVGLLQARFKETAEIDLQLLPSLSRYLLLLGLKHCNHSQLFHLQQSF